MIFRIFAEAKTYSQSKISPGDLPNQRAVTGTDFQDVLTIVFTTIGALAFVVIVIAGLRYIAAAGDPQKTTAARNTIFYALIGLVLAISAQAIVVFMVKSV